MDPNQPVNPGTPLPQQPAQQPQPTPYQPQPTPYQPQPTVVQPAQAPVIQPQPAPQVFQQQPAPVNPMPTAAPAQPAFQPAYGAPLPPQAQFGQPAAQPVYGQSPIYATGSALPGSKSKLRIIAAVVIIVIVIAVGAGLALSGSGSNPVSKLSSAVSGPKDVEDRSDGTLDLSGLFDSQKSIKTQDVSAKLNQQITLSDGTTYMVTSVQRNFVSSSDYLVADPGKELIKINLVVGNRAISGNDYISSSRFQLKNSAGGLQDAVYAEPTDMADALVSGDVAPGKQTKGAIVFQVDKDEKVQAVTTNDEYESYTSDAKYTIKSEVSLL